MREVTKYIVLLFRMWSSNKHTVLQVEERTVCSFMVGGNRIIRS